LEEKTKRREKTILLGLAANLRARGKKDSDERGSGGQRKVDIEKGEKA